MANPKVTVGMPAFNRAQVLKSTIEQVLNQTFQDFEFIIYNDGSTDNTIEIINSFNDPRIQLLDYENMGPPYPLNGILNIAKGEFIIILHDHDFFDPTLLEKSIDALERNPNAGFVLQGSAWIDEDGLSNYREMLLDLPEYNNGHEHAVRMLTNKDNFNSIFHACCMVRSISHKNAGWYYDAKFGLYADIDLWYRLLNVTDFVYLNEVLFKFRTREGNGHFLNNKEFEILNWVYQIANTNINRFFYDSKELENIKQILHNKWIKHIKITTIKSACQKNYNLFLKGLNLISDNSKNSTKLLLIKMISTNTFAIKGLINIIFISNLLRKKYLYLYKFSNNIYYS